MKFRVVGKLYHLARIPRVSRFCSFIFPFFSSFEYREIIRCFVFNRFKKLDSKEKKKNWFQVPKRRNCWVRYCCRRTELPCANQRTKLTGSSRSKLNTRTWGPITSRPTAVRAWINGWTHWLWRLSFRIQARKWPLTFRALITRFTHFTPIYQYRRWKFDDRNWK